MYIFIQQDTIVLVVKFLIKMWYYFVDRYIHTAMRLNWIEKMDKDEDLKDGGGEPEKTRDNDDKSSDIIEIKDDSSQDGGKASPIAAESPSGSR